MPASRRRSPSQLIVTTIVPISATRPRKGEQEPALGSFMAALATPLGGIAATPTWKKLACVVPRQEQSNWCWCATTLGVHKYYVNSDTTTQCQAANQILSRTDACLAPTLDTVNRTYYLDKALASFNHLSGSIIGTPLATSQVAKEIQSGSPIGARIGWPDNGGHFMAIVGYLDADVPRVAISDPAFGDSDMDYDVYLRAYQGDGTWTHSYLTQ